MRHSIKGYMTGNQNYLVPFDMTTELLYLDIHNFHIRPGQIDLKYLNVAIKNTAWTLKQSETKTIFIMEDQTMQEHMYQMCKSLKEYDDNLNNG